jgi:vitamin B12 transporter
MTSRFQGERRFDDLTLDWRAGNLGVVAGVETETEDVDIDQGFATVVAQQDHHGAFVTAQNGLGQLTLTGALRLDEFEGFGAETTWRAGVSFAMNDTMRVYGAYGTSFRAPTLYERFIFFGDPNLDPEHGRAWEVGADAQFGAFGRGDGVKLALVYRSQEIEDLIDFNAALIYANIDEAEIDSAEARLALRPTSWLTARIAYVYTSAHNASAGAPLLRRPEVAWNASLDIEYGAVSGELAWRRVGERADQIYGNDGVWSGVGLTRAYDVLRASAAWTFVDGARVFVAADNLTDAAYEPVNAFAGAPRSVMLGVRLRQ